MSPLKYWISIFALVTIGAGCGGNDGGGDGPDASGSTPDAGQRDAGADAGELVTPSCERYCELVMTNCTGDEAQYTDMTVCLSVCTAVEWEVGQSSDQQGNTLGCRIRHAGDLAATDSAAHCPSAGLAGNDVCGTWCDVFCAVNLQTCTGRNAQFESEAACLSACAGFRDDGSVYDDMGDTVQCRLHHSGYPSIRDPQTSCPYTGEQPSNYCIDPFSF